MRKFAYLLAMLLMMVVTVLAQDIKEVNGIYLKGETPYSGEFTIFYDNGTPKIEMSLVDGMKEGAVKVYFENGTLSEIRSYKKIYTFHRSLL